MLALSQALRRSARTEPLPFGGMRSKFRSTVSSHASDLAATALGSRGQRRALKGDLMIPRPAIITFAAAVTSLFPSIGYATDPVGVIFNIELNRASTAGSICESGSTGDWQIRLQTNQASDFIVQDVAFEAQGHSGWHSHPGPVLITVKSGTATWYEGSDPDCTPHIYPAGSAFVEPTNSVHTVQNESDVEELELFGTFIIPVGADRRIDQPEPGQCPQIH